jgi:hypothetical protein
MGKSVTFALTINNNKKISIMKNLNLITDLRNQVLNANTADANGRQTVANNCKTLYNLIEQDLGDTLTDSEYDRVCNDLFRGNFSNAAMCNDKVALFIHHADFYVNY